TPTPTGTPSCTPAWRTEPPMANARRNPATVAVGSNLYAITGFNAAPDYTAVNESFNGTSWTTMAPIPVPHAQSRGTAVGTFIYNPGTNSYTTGAPMPAGQGNVAGVLFNGEIYVVGGGTAPGAQYAYNPTTNTWRTIAVLPTTGGTCQSDNGFVLNNELWVVGCLGLAINQQV